MSVSWQDSTSPARVKAIAAAEASGEFDHTVPTWGVYADLREALIWALLITGFPTKSAWEITERNWQAVYERLCILEQVNGCFRIYNNGDRKSRSVFFSPEEVRSMVGLSVNAGNKSDAEFRKYIHCKLQERATSSLQRLDDTWEQEYSGWISRHDAREQH